MMMKHEIMMKRKENQRMMEVYKSYYITYTIFMLIRIELMFDKNKFGKWSTCLNNDISTGTTYLDTCVD